MALYYFNLHSIPYWISFAISILIIVLLLLKKRQDKQVQMFLIAIISIAVTSFSAAMDNCSRYYSVKEIWAAINTVSSILAVTFFFHFSFVYLTKKQIKDINGLSQKVGIIMKEKGYKGFFGLDFLVEGDSDKIYLSEVNARLTASTSFYTYLEKGLGRTPLLIYHIASFLEKDIPDNERWISKLVGSQIIFRSQAAKLKFLAFYDFGAVWNIQPRAGSKRRRTGACLGAGIRMSINKNIFASALAAKPITRRVNTQSLARRNAKGWRLFLSLNIVI